jgi:hypothetical protein
MDLVNPERRRYLVRANRVDERDKAIVSHVEFPTQGIGDFV